jgi:hypothetical protein
MALNGGIRAAHLGAPGDALSVLAGAMQQLAQESGELAESFVAALGSMSEAAAGLSGPGGSGRAPDGGAEGMRLAVENLRSSSERGFAQVAGITARGASLREDLSATRESFSVGPIFAEAVSRARGMLLEIVAMDRSDSSRRGEWQRDLTDWARHYTMQAERDVHEGVAPAAADAAPAAVPEQPAFPSAEAEGLGENVEFF